MSKRQKQNFVLWIFLPAVLFLPGMLFAQRNLTETKTILGHTYRFVTDTEAYSVIYLRILNEKDSVLFDRLAVINGGDCNYHKIEACGYELKGDHLCVYTYKHDSDSYGYFPGIVSYLAMKEEFVFQKSGKLVRTGWISGGPDTEVWKEVQTKISRQINFAESQ